MCNIRVIDTVKKCDTLTTYNLTVTLPWSQYVAAVVLKWIRNLVVKDYCVRYIFSDFFVRMHCFPDATEVADSFNKSSLTMTLKESITLYWRMTQVRKMMYCTNVKNTNIFVDRRSRIEYSSHTICLLIYIFYIILFCIRIILIWVRINL